MADDERTDDDDFGIEEEPSKPPLLPPLVPEIPASRSLPRLENAARAVALDKITVQAAAEKFEVDPDDLHRLVRARRDRTGSENLPQPREERPAEDPSETAATWRGRKSNLKFVEKPEITFDQSWDDPEAPRQGAEEQAIENIPLVRWLFGSKIRGAVVMAIVITSLVAGIVTLSRTFDKNTPSLEQTGDGNAELARIESEKTQAESVARAFLAAPNWQEKLPYVRAPERAKPRMEEWYARDGVTPPPVPENLSFHKIVPTMIGTNRYVILEAASDDPQAPIVLAVDVSDGEPKVDWESHVMYQPMSWAEFKRARPKKSIAFRVRAEPSNELMAPFDAPEKWISLRITSPNQIVGLNAYADRGSPLALELANLFQFGGQWQRTMILHLRFPEDDQSNPAVEITDAVIGWVE